MWPFSPPLTRFSSPHFLFTSPKYSRPIHIGVQPPGCNTHTHSVQIISAYPSHSFGYYCSQESIKESHIYFFLKWLNLHSKHRSAVVYSKLFWVKWKTDQTSAFLKSPTRMANVLKMTFSTLDMVMNKCHFNRSLHWCTFENL